MRRVALVSAAALLGLAAPAPTAAKEFVSLVVTGAAGDSVELGAPAGLVDSFFDSANSFNRGRRPSDATPRGGYVRLYPLGRGGFVGIPGRFYPESAAACFDWLQWRAPRDCWRPNPALLRLLAPVGKLTRFRGRPTTVARLSQPRLNRSVRRQLFVVFELAFDRFRLARAAPRPEACIPFTARWSGRAATTRPRRFCLAAKGVFAGGSVYPLGSSVWRFARLNLLS